MKALLAVLVLAASAGCATVGPYQGVIDGALAGGRLAADAGKAIAVAQKSVPGCYVAGSFSAADGAALQAFDAYYASKGTPTIPGVDVDVSDCLALDPGKPLVPAGVQQWTDVLAAPVTSGIADLVSASTASCAEKAWTRGVMRYLDGVALALVAQLAAPTGKLSIPAVPIDLSLCPPPPPPPSSVKKVLARRVVLSVSP